MNKLPFPIWAQAKSEWREQRPSFQGGSTDVIGSAALWGCEAEQLNSAWGTAGSRWDSLPSQD